jgi:hypothetical protein
MRTQILLYISSIKVILYQNYYSHNQVLLFYPFIFSYEIIVKAMIKDSPNDPILLELKERIQDRLKKAMQRDEHKSKTPLDRPSN